MSKKLKEMLVRHEAMQLKPYKCTAGKTTIGVGRNLDDLGITEGEALHMLENDIRRVRLELESYPWYSKLNVVRQDALMNMCFNLGISRFRTFKNMITALGVGAWARAADETMDSKWARQVGKRSTELAMMIRYGEYME